MCLAHFLFWTCWFFAIVIFFTKLFPEVFSWTSSSFGLPFLPSFVFFHSFCFPISFSRCSLKLLVQRLSIVYIYICSLYKFAFTSSTAQGGGGSFKNRKPIGELGCCEWGMAERSHWWTERCLRSPLFLSLFLWLSTYLPAYLLCIYLSIDLSISFFLSSNYLSTYLSIHLSISLSFICLSV